MIAFEDDQMWWYYEYIYNISSGTNCLLVDFSNPANNADRLSNHDGYHVKEDKYNYILIHTTAPTKSRCCCV